MAVGYAFDRDATRPTECGTGSGWRFRPAQALAGQAAAALRHPELADLPSEVRRVLVQGGYTTREAVAWASDADLLLLKRMSMVRLGAVRAVIPRAE